MPAYNAARTLRMTYADLPREMVDLVILVDDGSSDETARIARELGLELFLHDRNYGYGANQKTCYREALRAGADIVAMVHPDYQYDPTLLPQIIRPIVEGKADVVLGSRLMGANPMAQGMPWWKYYSNRFLTALENRAFGLRLSEYHTGYRAFRPRRAGIRQFPDELRHVHLRPGDHRADGQSRPAHRRGPGARPAISRRPRRPPSGKAPVTAARSSGCCSGICCTAKGYSASASSTAWTGGTPIPAWARKHRNRQREVQGFRSLSPKCPKCHTGERSRFPCGFPRPRFPAEFYFRAFGL